MTSILLSIITTAVIGGFVVYVTKVVRGRRRNHVYIPSAKQPRVRHVYIGEVQGCTIHGRYYMTYGLSPSELTRLILPPVVHDIFKYYHPDGTIVLYKKGSDITVYRVTSIVGNKITCELCKYNVVDVALLGYIPKAYPTANLPLTVYSVADKTLDAYVRGDKLEPA